MRLCRDYITPVDATQIPTGSLVPVNNTPFDFTTLRRIGSQIKGVSCGVSGPGRYDEAKLPSRWLAVFCMQV